MIGRADIKGSKSNVAMNAWLPQASYPCVMCRPSQTPRLTMSSAWIVPQIPSRLFDARGRDLEGPVPVRPPATRSCCGSSSSNPPTADGKKMENDRISREEFQENSTKEKLSKNDSDDEMLSTILKKTGRSLHKPMIDEPQTIEIQKTLMSNDSSNGGTNDILKSENWLGLSNTRVEYQQVVDELMDSEDDEAAGALPNNAISRRKLRMIIDPEDDD
ncbi:hypothetical protein K1719_026605 [Acacia pycnantha]|nr:hypothetical protein K1719_026605 [Acacia pycnantha]